MLLRSGLLLVLLLGAAPLSATTADDLCDPDDDPCRVTTTVAVTPGSVIDVGTRELLLAGTGRLNLASGLMTLRAGTLRVERNAALLAAGSRTVPGGAIDVTAGTIVIDGLVDVSGADAGRLTLTSSGPVTITGTIDARNDATEASGGSVTIQGSVVSLGGSIQLQGGSQDFGGDLVVQAMTSLSLTGPVTASGGDGGSIDVRSNGPLTVGTLAALNVNATAGGGAGGEITLSAGGALALDATLSADGRSGSSATGGGDGGQIALDGATLRIDRAGVRVSATGGGPDGLGGDIDLAATGMLTVIGQLDASGPGSEGSGGDVSLDGNPVVLGGPVNVSGGGDSGGELDVSSGGDLTLTAAAAVTAAATAGGSGGTITLIGGGTVRVQSALTTDGGNAGGALGGDIVLGGCLVELTSGARLSSLRAEGSNTLLGRDRSIIAGTLRADPTSGLNEVRFAGPGYEPDIAAGASITPALVPVVDGAIVPCNPIATPTPTATGSQPPTATATPTIDGPPPTATATTSAPGDTPTATPTPTVVPGDCVGDCRNVGEVGIADLILCVNIALGERSVAVCPACDPSGDGMVGVNELILAVNNALNGCPEE